MGQCHHRCVSGTDDDLSDRSSSRTVTRGSSDLTRSQVESSAPRPVIFHLWPDEPPMSKRSAGEAALASSCLPRRVTRSQLAAGEVDDASLSGGLPSPRRATLSPAAKAARQAKAQQTRLANLRAKSAAKEARAAAKEAMAAAVSLPAHWDDDPSGVMSITLDEKNPAHAAERQEVIDHFNATGATGVTVTRVERVQNPHIYRAYEARKKELSGPTYRELHVYHGSKTNAPQLIIKNGFNVAYGAAMSGHLWFASSSGYSVSGFAHTSSLGEFQIFRASVYPLTHENQNYNGQIYTIGDSSRMLPTYLITFRQAVVYRSP